MAFRQQSVKEFNSTLIVSFLILDTKSQKVLRFWFMMKIKVKAVFQAKWPGGKVSLTLSEELNFKANYEHWALFKKFGT